MTATATKPKSARKARVAPPKDRRINWAARTAEGTGVLRITQDGETQHYFCRPVAGGYELEKIDQGEGKVAATYAVKVGKRPSCSCPGWWSHHRCKHSAGIAAMVERKLM